MSIKILQERLDSYHCQSEQEETNALKEIMQEINQEKVGATLEEAQQN